MGENAADTFTQRGKMAHIIRTVTASQMCVCVSLLDAFRQEILLTLGTESPTKPQQGLLITLNDTGTYLPLVSKEGTGITLPFSLFGSFVLPLTPIRNSIITDTLKSHYAKQLIVL